MLAAAPFIDCWEPDHLFFFGFSLLAVIVYAVGIPTATYAVLRYGRTHDLLRERRFFKRFGFAYDSVHMRCYHYQVVLQLRRGLLTIPTAFLEPVDIQVLFSSVVLSLSLLASVDGPFLQSRINVLDTLCLFGAGVYLLCGTLIYSGSLIADTLTAVMCSIVAVCLLSALVLICQDLWALRTKTQNEEQLHLRFGLT